MSMHIDGKSVETHEKPPLLGRTIWFTGASHGAGLAIAQRAHNLGSRVIIGTRSLDNYNKVQALIGEEKVLPFFADLGKPAEVINSVGELIGGYGLVPTDIVFAAAGGLDSFILTVTKTALGLTRKPEEERLAGVKTLASQINELVQKNYEETFQINSASHKIILSQLFDHLRPGSRVIFLSSLYSDLFGRDGFIIPNFYQGVAKSKHDFITYLEEVAPQYNAKGIHIAILSGHLLSDSDTGRMLVNLGNRLREKLPGVIEIPAGLNLPKTEDMAIEAERLLLSDAKTWPQPYRRYVVGAGTVVDSIEPALIEELAKIKINL